MAWSSVGQAGSAVSGGNNQASIAVTLNTQAGSGAAIGDLLVLTVAVDNASSSDGDEGAVTGVVDSGGVNVWSKAAEFCNGQGASQAGATCSIWYAPITSALTTAATVTASFSNNTARDATAANVWRFTASTGTPAVAATTWLAADAAQPGSIDISAPVPGTSYIRFRGIASESTLTTALTTTAGWTTIGTGRASATAAMSYRGEFVISTATTQASNPTFSATPDHASVYALFVENAAPEKIMGQMVL